MSRDFVINGESMVSVKGNGGTSIASLTQLGLSDRDIPVSFEHFHHDLVVDATGEAPVDVQALGEVANITMTLIHWDYAVLEAVINESLGGATTIGTLARAGTRLGGGNSRFATGWHFVGLNISSPIAGRPYRFYNAYLSAQPVTIPLGTKKSIVTLQWRVLPYQVDPWNGGVGSSGVVLFDRTLDS